MGMCNNATSQPVNRPVTSPSPQNSNKQPIAAHANEFKGVAEPSLRDNITAGVQSQMELETAQWINQQQMRLSELNNQSPMETDEDSSVELSQPLTGVGSELSDIDVNTLPRTGLGGSTSPF